MEQTSFETEFTVMYPDCDINNRMRVSNIMRQVQQIGGAHLDSLGLTYERMAADGVVLLLAKEGLTIKRLPKGGETVRIVTAPRHPQKAVLLRDCTFYDKNGDEMIFAETTWVAANTNSHRIIRPAELTYDIIPSLEEKEYAVTSMRVRMPKNGYEAGRRVVRFSDIDCNRHLNNAVYADIVYDFLPFEAAQHYEPKTFFVHFQHEAALGEELTVTVGETGRPEAPAFVVSAAKPDGACCFMSYIEF